MSIPDVLALGLAAYVAVSTLVGWRFTQARRQRLPAAAVGQPVGFPSRDGLAHIVGTYLGSRPGAPAIVVVHGKDACRGNALGAPTAALVEGLQRAGFAMLAIDLRGHGSSGPARLTYGALECQDVLGAVDWLQALGHRRIGVLGAPMGAVATLKAAALEPAIEAVVADSAFADLGEILQHNYRRLTHLPGAMFPAAALAARWFTGVDLRRFRPLDLASALASRPVLLIHSEGDRLVPCEHAHCLARAIGAPLWTTPSKGHLSSYRSDPAAYALLLHRFFATALLAEPAFPAAAAA